MCLSFDLHKIIVICASHFCYMCLIIYSYQTTTHERRNKDMMKFERGQIYQREDDNIFIKGVSDKMVRFIEGFSPSAIHNMQEIPIENLEQYIKKYGFERASEEYEAFVNA